VGRHWRFGWPWVFVAAKKKKEIKSGGLREQRISKEVSELCTERRQAPVAQHGIWGA